MQELYDNIITWFHNNRPFEEGVALYQQYGSNVNLKRIFARGFTDFAAGLLLNEFTELHKSLEKSLPKKPLVLQVANQKVVLVDEKVKTEPAAEENVNVVTIDLEGLQYNKLDYVRLPEHLKALVVLRTKLYVKSSSLHKKLGSCYSDESRGQLAETIVENMRENAEIWQELDYWKKTNTILGNHKSFKAEVIKTELSDLPLHELQKRLMNRRTNISTYKKWIKENPDKEDICQKKAAKIGEWEIEVLNIETLLKNGKTL